MGRLQLQNLRTLLDKEALEEFCSESCESFDTSASCKSNCLSFCPNYNCLVPPKSPVVFTYDHESKSRKFLIITLTVFAVTFVALLCYILYFKCHLARRASRRRAQLEAEVFRGNFIDQDHHGPEIDHHVWYINTVGLQPGIISSITVCQYKKGDGLVEGTECSVCLNEFEEDETLRLLPKCNHAFHLPCIDTWLRSHTNCPLCRAPILKNNATGDSSSSESSTDNSSASSHTQVDVAEGHGETARELEEGFLERRVVTEFGSELPLERGRIKRSGSSDEIQAIRRSVSLDSLTASKLSKSLANFVNIPEETKDNSDTQVEAEKDSRLEIASKRVTRNGSLPRFTSSSSIVRSLQIGQVSFKRSSSYSGKFLLPRRS